MEKMTRAETTMTRAINTDGTTTVEPAVIAGAGIVGLVLALALEKHLGIKPLIYDQAKGFHDGVGAGIGMYPNGLRVIRDISPLLLARIQHVGVPYHQRRWERHDGTEVAVADEAVISDDSYAYNLEPMGVRRWKLQKILYDAALKKGIRVIFSKKVKKAVPVHNNGCPPLIQLEFHDKTFVTTELLLAADGAKSAVRESMLDQIASKLKLTGTTCMYGVATLPHKVPAGLRLPSSSTTKCHGAFYATGEQEQCFQFHMTTPRDVDTDSGYDSDESSKAVSVLHSIWDPLSSQLCREECQGLAEVLADDGWDESYLLPLRNAEKAIKVPFALLDPPLETFLYHQNRVVLLGDAAHPPVPYLGQGAQQGIEDAGTLAILLKSMNAVHRGSGGSAFDSSALDVALKLYNKLRVPRTRDMLERSKDHGEMQQKRAEAHSRVHARAREQLLQRDVFFHETLKDVLPGATYDYKEAAMQAIKEEPLMTISESSTYNDEGENAAVELSCPHIQAVKL
jgi:salicylate hydroxylase